MGIPNDQFPYYLLGLAIIYLAGLLLWLLRKKTFSGSKDWPTTSGKVEGYLQGGYDVKTRPWSERNAPIALTYSYSVNGEYRSALKFTIRPTSLSSLACCCAKAPLIRAITFTLE
jgi:hypothetical protein